MRRDLSLAGRSKKSRCGYGKSRRATLLSGSPIIDANEPTRPGPERTAFWLDEPFDPINLKGSRGQTRAARAAFPRSEACNHTPRACCVLIASQRSGLGPDYSTIFAHHSPASPAVLLLTHPILSLLSSWRLLIHITHRFMDLLSIRFTTLRDLVDLLPAWRVLSAYVLPAA